MFVIPLIFVLIALDPPKVCFIIASIYALSGIANAVWRRQRRQTARTRRHADGPDTDP